MEFAVKIKETLERTVIIEAEDKYQALEIVEDKANDEINLDAKDFSGREVLISDEFPDGADVSHYMHVTNIVNTKISYLYRDASNYKAYNEVIIKGKISPGQINQIMECLDDGEYFIPCQIGFPESRIGEVDPEVDHCWFELERSSFECTSEPETIEMTADELVQAFKEASGNWDEFLWMQDVEWEEDEEEDEEDEEE